MIDELTPVTRKFVAVSLLLLFILLFWTLIILPVYERMANSVNGLADTRYQIAKLESIRNRPEPVSGNALTPGSLISAKTHAQAEAILAARVQALIVPASGVTNIIKPLGPEPVVSVAAIEVNIEGDEQAIIALIEQIENALPLMRLRSWSIEPVLAPVNLASAGNPDIAALADPNISSGSAKQMRLSAIIVAAWEVR
jgi:hypothetical protein